MTKVNAMDSRKKILKDTALLALGELLFGGVMVGVFAAFRAFSLTVVLSALAGCLVITLNYFFMCVTVSMAADRAEKQDVAGGQKLMKSSYPIRLLTLAVVLILCAKSGYFNVLALVLPLAFVRVTITIYEFFRKKGE